MAREPEIIAEFRRLAERGDAAAQFNLGEAYRLGNRIGRDVREAVRWFHHAAAQGHAQARRALDQLKSQGVDVSPPPDASAPAHRPQSLDDLLDSLKPAAAPEGDGGHELALAPPEPDSDALDLGGGDEPVDTAAVSAAAEGGNTAAQVVMGNCHRLGLGVARDDARAAEWYRRAAEAGDVRGQYALAQMYDQGLGVAASAAEALRWYLAAAQGGDAEAQFNLANMIRDGRGCRADPAVAAQWYRKAAAQGDPAALFALGALHESGSGVAADPARAVAYYRQAADKGDADAQFNLANLLRKGVGAEIDPTEAANLYRRAAQQGLAVAQYNYGLMLAAGTGVTRDPAAALMWLRAAARGGDPHARAMLAEHGDS
ncbi:tetratricopeptide repeat protein [Magnetospirillum sp. UT-4]|uniref:tetratricopeptide repeat protein n=1 Tax=Magnetospirillum sp. UT-4 TaxID=2681467 RepID=UPI001382350A|nr:tetratricopeptide repeat protein [Magnetospirillum sp. UT-4]CAA7623645.1 conserved hypothetical protein [Magnetospirillum sp. UT-4]